ncbi:MAG TPA: hypothetical protein VKX40_10505 [Aequorivita sp.]|nr:hypothetical protein [Aequorivita sp.]
MARIENDRLKLRGMLGDMIFSAGEKEDETYVRRKPGKNKERFRNHPDSQGSRNMTKEMSGASTAAKALRLALELKGRQLGDRFFSGRLNGKLRLAIGLGAGDPGKRILDIRKNGAPMEGFEFIRMRPLVYSIGGIEEKPTLSLGRNEVYWSSPILNRKEQITSPDGATHFKFILGAVGLCNYQYNPQRDEYLPTLNPPTLTGKFEYSEVISLSQKSIAPVSLGVKLADTALLEEMGVVTAVGVEFYRNVNGEMLKMENSLAMRVLGVF